MESYKIEILKDQLSKILKLNNKFIYAVPWIQPVKIDENSIKDYEFIFSKNAIKFQFTLLKSIFEIFVCISKICLSIFVYPKKKFFSADIIILSHLINKKNNILKSDFYFGKLEEYLNKNNLTTQKVLINHTKLKSLYKLDSLAYVLPKIDNFYIEILILLKQISLFVFSIKNISKLKKLKVKWTIILIFLLKIFSQSTQSALRIAFQVNKLSKYFTSKYIFMTFEGYCYEKCISILNSKSKIIAYQNTPLNICQFSIHYYNKNSLPNLIFSKNEIYQEHLKKIKNLKCKIICLGDLNYQPYKSLSLTKYKYSILFIPEGNLHEVSLMLEFINNNYYDNQNIKFTIRFHPMFPINTIKFYKSKFKKTKNVFFSTNSLIKDLSKNSFTLYRGSSLVFQTIRAGLIPIYLDKGIDIDVLKILNIATHRFNFNNKISLNYLKNLKSNNKHSRTIKNLFNQPNYNLIYNELSQSY